MISDRSQSMHTPAMFSVSQRSEILQGLIEIASTLANKQLDAFTTHLADALRQAAAQVPHEEQLRLNASNLLKKNRYPFYYVASERLAAALQREVRALEGLPLEPEVASIKPLAPDVEIDKKLSLMAASRGVESEHAERLVALNIRLACLLGQDELATAENPFRPQIFLSALHEAWCQFHPDAEAHHLVFQLLGPKLCLEMGSILHALNAALVKRGIMPKLTDSPRVKPVVQEESDGDLVIRQLRRLFADTALNAGALRDQLLAYLAEVQKNGPAPYQAAAAGGTPGGSLLAHVRRWAPQGILSQTDLHAIDLLIEVFEAIFKEDNIPAEIQTLIGSLQIPVLKATLTDKEFFFTHTHPARHVIELLAHLGVAWDCKKGPNDPLYQTILRNVKRIQSDQRLASFSDAVADLESFINAEDAESKQALSISIAQALEQEKHLQASKVAKHEVALRIGTGEVVAFVEAFLEDKWTSVLTLAYAIKDDKPQALDSTIKTMDDLCWSVKPKITMDERKNLIAKLPGIIATLNKWLDLIKWNDAARAKFFDDLAKCHASIVRAPLELSPERQMQIALAVAKKAAERRLVRQADQPAAPAPDAFNETVGLFQCGTWMEFTHEGDKAMRAKLAWISPMRSFFVFSNRVRQEVLSVSDEELAQSLREGRAQIVLEAGLVSRALTQALIGQSAGNDGLAGKAAA